MKTIISKKGFITSIFAFLSLCLAGCGNAKIADSENDLCMNPDYINFGYIKNLRMDIEAHTLPEHFIEGFYSGKTFKSDKKFFEDNGIDYYKTCHYEATKGKLKGERITIKIFEYDGGLYVVDSSVIQNIIEMSEEDRKRFIFE